MIHEDDVAGLLAAEVVGVGTHLARDGGVAHIGAHQPDSRVAQGELEAEIAHHCRNDGFGAELPFGSHPDSEQRHHVIAVEQLSFFIDQDRAVIEERANIGIAIDGDGDRAILVDEKGELFDGDDVMALLGIRMASEGKLSAKTVVATVMSNFGLELALRNAGIRLVRTDVGDPAVAREMRTNSYNLGGEQSGHVIFMDHSTTGDGLITALLVLTVMAESGRPLSELRAMQRVPQVLENVRIRERRPLSEIPAVQRAITAAERQLNGTGRLLVRYSGTEMLARVMVEGEDAGRISAIAKEIGAAIRKHLGA